jgi:hypothetical protein
MFSSHIAWGGASPCRWPFGRRRQAKANGYLHMIWVRFVASGAGQKLGAKAEATPHNVVPRRCRRMSSTPGYNVEQGPR